MSFYIRIKYEESDEWVDLLSSSSHLLELTDSGGVYRGRFIREMMLSNGSVYCFKTRQWKPHVPPCAHSSREHLKRLCWA